jgi:hypothetical protein
MKKISCSLLSICCLVAAHAQQIRIMPGTFLSGKHQLQLVLHDGMNLENNTDLALPSLSILASGSRNSHINGSGLLTAGQLQISKSGGSKLILEKDISIAGEINFREGYLDLNAHTLQLLPNASLKNEQSVSRIIGSNGGSVQISVNLHQPMNVNPGNLGLIISSASDPGMTVIRRSHRVITNSAGGSSISRSFELEAMSPLVSNATLTMQYFDEELNGFQENLLEWYQSPNHGQSWYARGAKERDFSRNLISAENIRSLDAFTLSTINNPLPVRLSSMSLSCENDQPTLKWKTANPQDAATFRIEKSFNSQHWETVTSIAPQSSPGYEYKYTDNQRPAEFYRISSIEYNGEISYSPVLRTDCRGKENSFALLANPVQDALSLNIIASRSKKLGIQIINTQGKILYSSSLQVSNGHSIRSIALSAGSKGLHYIRIMENGASIWTKAFLKI